MQGVGKNHRMKKVLLKYYVESFVSFSVTSRFSEINDFCSGRLARNGTFPLMELI